MAYAKTKKTMIKKLKDRTQIHIDVKGADARSLLVDELEKEGFVYSREEIRSKREVIEGKFPITVVMKDRSFFMMGNVMCAAAAASAGALVSVDEFWSFYKESKH